MSTCNHCSSPIADSSIEDFCCRGCESVYQLIHADGLGLFYDLKADDTLAPLREKPFQQKDWSWLLELAVTQHGKSVGQLTLGLGGMTCMACVWLVETVTKQHAGVIETCADNAHGALEITYQSTSCDLVELAESLQKLGYEILPKKLGKQAGLTESLTIRLGICGALAMNAMAFSLPRYNGMETSDELSSLLTTVTIASATLALLIGGSYFFKRAWKALRLGGIHMDLPISLGLIISYVGSLVGWSTGHEDLFYFDFVAIFTFLMLAGKQLQISSLNKANSRFQADTTIPDFYKTEDGELLETTEIPANAKLQIPSGTVIPADSRLLSEVADLSLAWITGEPSSQLFHHTAPIPAGAVNQSSAAINVQTSKPTSENSAIAKLLATDIKSPSSKNSQAQQRAIQIYLGVIILLGLVMAGIWYFTTNDWVKSLQVLISIYVVSCPCGIGLALPLLDTRSSKRIQSFGVFPLTSRFWEQLAQIKKVVFDKTGTLTLDKPELIDSTALENLSDIEKEVLFTLTRSSLHPLSRSLFSELIKRGVSCSTLTEETTETPGSGTSIKLEDGSTYYLGRSAAHAQNSNLSCTFSKGDQVISEFNFTESARSEAAHSISILNSKLPSPCLILSGDDSSRVATIAKKLQIPEHFGDLLPEDKRQKVAELEKQLHTLYLGDGINDLPALQEASLSGAPFANINMLTADVDFLFTDETMAFLPQLTGVSQQRRKTKRALILYTLLYNASALAVAACGLMSPLGAAIIMPLSSLLSIAIVSKPFRNISP